MGRIRLLLLGATLAVGASATGGASAHDCAQHETAAGSKKCETSGYEIQCGDNGKVPLEAGGLSLHVNPQGSKGPEAEACNDTGPGQTQGRLNVHVDPDAGYARASLDSDPNQEQFEPGFINVQVGPGAEQTGIWCTPTTASGDGYSRPATSPSGGEGGSVTQPDQWVECIPGN